MNDDTDLDYDPEVQARLAIASGRASPLLSYRDRLKSAILDDLEGAVFRVVWVDPECSGVEWSGHQGAIIVRAHRCCSRCTIVWGNAQGCHYDIGPFGDRELEPLNEEARQIATEIAHFKGATWPTALLQTAATQGT